MMEIDNFELVRKHLHFDAENDPDLFYFVQIIARRKDSGTTIKKSQKQIRTFYIRSLSYYDDHIEQIKAFCKMFNARAYIRLTPSSWRKCVIKAFGELATYLNNNQCSSLRGITDSVAGKYPADGVQKLWLIDIDTKEKRVVDRAMNIVNKCSPNAGGPSKVRELVPTKNGVHVITTPFNLQEFKEHWIDANIEEDAYDSCPDIHRNNPTLLYYYED